MFFFHGKMIGFIIGLGLHNELSEGINPIIQNCKEIRWKWVNNASSRLNP
jgi:hypothetical protein